MRILLTGFEPFGGRTRNPAEEIARALDGAMLNDVRVVSRILTVDTKRAPRQLSAALAEVRPQAIVCLGEASNRLTISIERLAVNLLDFRMADNAGNRPVDQAIDPTGPAALFATLPVRDLFEVLKASEVPVDLSLSAGAYLCNQIMYHALREVQGTDILAGFIHLPRNFTDPRFDLDYDLPAIRDGVRLLLTTLAAHLRVGQIMAQPLTGACKK